MFSAQIFCHLFNSMEGEMGAYDIAVLSLFSSGISVIWILKWVIVVSGGMRFFILLANGIQ